MSPEKNKTLRTQALTAERFQQSAWCFQLAKNALVDTRPNALVAQRFSSWDALVAMIRNIHGSNVLLVSDFEEYYWI